MTRLDVERLTRVLRTLWLNPAYIDADASENGYRTIAEAIASEYEHAIDEIEAEAGQASGFWPDFLVFHAIDMHGCTHLHDPRTDG